ncbi:hypothetical protein [Nocardia sp. XZ_19_385]|uniref:hypothetical protein n=1 Tax=Nocardia sp. XZ_19_385 TaxID=2769488 RepID=UPI00188F2EA7|nr:hypothetical protein [Nocardia sp. XZ_19_385]
MRFGRKTTRSVTTAALIAAPLVAFAPMASAGDPLWSAVTTTSSGACIGHIAFEPIYGPNTPYFALLTAMHGIGPCSVEAFVNWRNLDTGASGTVRQWLYGSGGYQISFAPGPGRITGTITTDALHRAGYFEFDRTAP